MLNRPKANLLPIIVSLGILLSGCVTANTSIVVQADGSGEFVTSIGFPVEFIAVMTSKGIDPIKELRKSLRQEIGLGVKVTQRDESGYKWMDIRRSFSNVDELNDIALRQAFIESFSLQRQRSFLKDRFILDAHLNFDGYSHPFSEKISEEEARSIFDPNTPIDFNVTLELPGKIIHSNGEYNRSNKTILWEATITDVLEIHASSEKWNTMSIAFTIALSVIAIGLIALTVFLLLRIRRKRKAPVEDEVVSQRLVESIQQEEEEEIPTESKVEKQTVIPPSKILAMIGARELLDQVNLHVLNHHGNISIGKGAIRLVWKDQHDESVTRGIMITVQDAETILINGVPFPATREAARQGLISCLKGMTKQ
jgi:hypothetical protein